jgi:hypothetical protein
MDRRVDGEGPGLEARIEALALERRQQAESLRPFDANAWLGEPAGFPLAREMQPPELLRALHGCGIQEALVSHWAGLRVAPQTGNGALAQALGGAGGAGGAGVAGVAGGALRACWTGLPLFPREDGPLPGAGSLPLAAGAVRLFPRSHNFPLASWALGELCSWLSQHHLPLFLWHVEIDWPALHALAVAFPHLAIVVETQTQKILYQNRALFALMKDCPNVHAETSNLVGADFLRWAARELGARRLLFGSFLPVNDPWVALGMILEADLSWEEKRLVAGDNLRRLLSEARA